MSETEPVSYARPGVANRASPNRRTALCILFVAAVVVAVNAYLVYVAYDDRSWEALGIMMLFGPITNGVLMFLSILMTPLVWHVTRAAASPYVAASIVLPILAVIVDGACISSMHLHGC